MSPRTRTCVLTGTTHGIGLQTAKLMASRGNTVIMLNRNAPRAELVKDHIRKVTGNEKVISLDCDLASLESVRRCAAAIYERQPEIDVLVNNAAVMSGKRELSADGIELTLAVNHIGPFLLTQLLIDALSESEQGRIVNLASSIHTIGRVGNDQSGHKGRYKSMRAYADSKLANVMHTLALARKYADTRITANCLHPGVVATNLLPADRPVLKWAGKLVRKVMRSPEESAQATAYLALSSELNNVSGKYFSPGRRIVEPSELARNTSAQDELWEASMRLAGLA